MAAFPFPEFTSALPTRWVRTHEATIGWAIAPQPLSPIRINADQ